MSHDEYMRELGAVQHSINLSWMKIKAIMENKNYYPLRVDKKFGSSIVSSTDPWRGTYLQKDKEYEIENYGGHIIAESLPSKELAEQLVDAYNEKYQPVAKPDHLPQTISIDGRQPMLGSGYKWQIITPDGYIYREDKQQSDDYLHLYKLAKAPEPISKEPEFPSEDYMDINSPPGTKVTVSEQSFKNGNEGDKQKAIKHLKVGEVYTVSKIHKGNWSTDVYIKELNNWFNSVQFVKYNPPVSKFKLPTNPDHIMKDGPQFDHLSDELKEKFVDEL